jgi:hypothetical protein
MKKYLKWIVFFLWVVFVFAVIVPFTPEVVGAFVIGAGTGFVMRAASHYLYYGTEGLKFWRWRHQPDPRDVRDV